MLSGDEEDEHYEKILQQLNDGSHEVFQRGGVYQPDGLYQKGGCRCPFDVKVLNTSYESLLQHAVGRGRAIQRKARDRAQHKALAEYLKNHPPLEEGARATSLEAVGAEP